MSGGLSWWRDALLASEVSCQPSGECYNPINTRSRSSTVAIVAGDTLPQRVMSRSLLMERTASQRSAEALVRPPSGGWTTTWNGMFLRVEVMGITTTRSARL